MDAETTVIANPLLALAGFAMVIAALLLLIAKWKWHVFFALLIPIVILGAIPGVSRENFIEAFESGFGRTLGKIGVVIALGSILAEALKQSGAVHVIIRSMVRLVGARRMPLALTLTGFILGLAVFSDVAFVILNPLVHSAAAAMGVGIASMATGLVGALQLTHAIVPPTPGPLAAAGILGADLGKTIVCGSVACLAGSLAAWLWGQYVVGPRIATQPSSEFAVDAEWEDPPAGRLPGTLSAYAPIAIPILLISAQSVAETTLNEGNMVREVLGYLGWPVVALGIGIWLAYRNIERRPDQARGDHQWIEEGLRTSAMILVVTGLGGSLSAILKGTPAVAVIAEGIQNSGVPAILLPFVLGVVGNMVTGSSTVGVITAASLAAPMLVTLGLSPEAAMLSGGCGSVIIKYVNSSYFWVCTSLSNLAVGDALLSYGGASLVGGVVAFLTVCAMWSVGIV